MSRSKSKIQWLLGACAIPRHNANIGVKYGFSMLANKVSINTKKTCLTTAIYLPSVCLLQIPKIALRARAGSTSQSTLGGREDN